MNQSSHASMPAKILVVDDHPNTANTLARAIAQLGSKVEVISATSGRQALECVKDGAADILITDMIMPEMTGLELIEELQKHPAGRPTFSFLITAYDVPGLKVTARRLNVKEVLIKPIHPQRICEIVSQALEEMHQLKPSQQEPDGRKRFSILIADDQPDNVTLLSRYIENEGYAYITARDGLETLEKVRSQLPDLVLLDINMPHKDGFAVLQEVRADPAVQHIPVIILTAARLDATEVQYGLNLGADDYVTKPFDRRELLARIRTKLRVKEAEDVIRRHNRELNLLPEIGKALSARLNIEELTTILLKHTVETLGAMLGHVVIFDSCGAYQKTYRLALSPAHSTDAEKYVLPNKVFEVINSTRQGFIVDDTSTDPRWQVTTDHLSKSAVIVPMFGRDHLLGMLALTNEQTNYFNLEHLLLLQAIASQASIALENAHLYASLAQEQQQLTAIVQSAAGAILVFDGNKSLSLANQAAQKLFADYQIHIGNALPSDRGYDGLINLLEETCTTRKAQTREILWPDQRAFAAVIAPIEYGGCVVILHDVTHFKDLERVKNEFISTASHDLKNPIAVISGFSDLILKAGPLNEAQTGFLERIHSAAENMHELVQSLLELAKMDIGVDFKKESVDMNALVFEVSKEYQLQAQAKQQKLLLKKDDDQLTVRGDALQLKQALRNLIGNAIKYTPTAGFINITVEEADADVVIRVEDTGYGIPAADLPFIFDRFYRVRNNDVNDIEGNGLGLAIVKSVVEQHGGQINVKSELGKGSYFTVALPLLSTSELALIESAQVQEQ